LVFLPFFFKVQPATSLQKPASLIFLHFFSFATQLNFLTLPPQRLLHDFWSKSLHALASSALVLIAASTSAVEAIVGVPVAAVEVIVGVPVSRTTTGATVGFATGDCTTAHSFRSLKQVCPVGHLASVPSEHAVCPHTLAAPHVAPHLKVPLVEPPLVLFDVPPLVLFEVGGGVGD